MATVGTVNVVLKAGTGAFVSGVQSAAGALQKSLGGALGFVGKSFGSVTRGIFGLQGAIGTLIGAAGAGGLVGSFISAGAQAETLRTRLIPLTGSAENARKEFERMAAFAAKTPFELQNVVEAGVSLRAFGESNRDALKAVGDLAAFMGVDIRQAAQSYGRAFAAGAGAADLLRDRGVLAMIQTRSGIEDLTKLSLPEFRKVLFESMVDPTGPIAGATSLLAKTWSGLMSNLKDAWFRFRQAVAESGLLAFFKAQAEGILKVIDEMSKNGQLQQWARKIAFFIIDAFSSMIRFAATAFNGLVNFGVSAFNAIQQAVSKFAGFALQALTKIFKVVIILAGGLEDLTSFFGAPFAGLSDAAKSLSTTVLQAVSDIQLTAAQAAKIEAPPVLKDIGGILNQAATSVEGFGKKAKEETLKLASGMQESTKNVAEIDGKLQSAGFTLGQMVTSGGGFGTIVESATGKVRALNTNLAQTLELVRGLQAQPVLNFGGGS